MDSALSRPVLEFTGDDPILYQSFPEFKQDTNTNKLSELTIELWVKLAAINKDIDIIAWQSLPFITLTVSHSGAVIVKHVKITTTPEPPKKIKGNQWTHLAFTWKRGGKLTIYIDGEKLLDRDTSGETWEWQLIGDVAFSAGSGGQLAEVCIWKKTLNDAQIKNRANKKSLIPHCPLNMVKNQPGWYTMSIGKDSFLLSPPSKLISYWPLNVPGTVITDEINSKNISLGNNQIKKTSDFPGYTEKWVLEFSGKNPEPDNTAPGTLYELSALTIEFWIKPAKDLLTATIINTPPNGTPGFFNAWLAVGKVAVSIVYREETYPNFSDEPIPVNKWTHVAVTFEEHKPPVLYIDGLIQTTKLDRWPAKAAFIDKLSFGAKYLWENEPLKIPQMSADTQLAELCIWSVSFSEEQIQARARRNIPFRFIRLTTGVTQQLAQKAFIGGIDHLLTLESQSSPESSFSQLYPAAASFSLPTNDSLDFYGAYGTYFQEIFFHLPFLVANTLSAHQRYSEARNWYHYIFNPTLHSTSGKSDAWRYLPLRNHSAETLQQILSDEQAIRAYNNNPSDPHAIARLRIGAYEKAVVMKYIDNLIAWGDACFAKDTWESITQASTLYMLAYDLLGPKPENIEKCKVPDAKKYQDFNEKREIVATPANTHNNTFHKAYTKHQKLKNIALDSKNYKAPAPINSFLDDTSYFCVLENEQFTAYWKKVEDQLFKIRHCQNIKGVVRELALFEPPLNPAELVRAATAGGMSQGVSLDLPVPHYRFEYMLEKARTITATVIQLGASLLSVLEKKDAETLSVMRANHESALLKLIKTTRKQQIKAAQSNRDALDVSLEAAKHRLSYYRDLLSAELSFWETAGQGLRLAATAFEADAALANYLSSPTYLIPTIFGLADGGFHPGSALQAIAAGDSSVAGTLNNLAASSEIMGQYQRRKEEWAQQAQMAQDDIELIRQQIHAADINVAIAKSELQVHEKSLKQAQEIDNFLKSRFTTPELYQWMSGRLSSIYFETFKIALEMALLAQKAYQFESNTDESYIVFDYWDGLKQGLLGGEGLMLCLNQLEKAHTEGNARRLEIEKTISLKKLCDNNFDDLKKGSLTFSLSEALFNNDFPQHYCRRIKTLSISIPAVLGPYENINATLIETGSKTRVRPGSDSADLKSDFQRKQKIALSRGINDSGMFELNFRDERYLPFEGTGAISDWELRIPRDNNLHLNYDSLTDVIIHLCYTALDDDQT